MSLDAFYRHVGMLLVLLYVAFAVYLLSMSLDLFYVE